MTTASAEGERAPVPGQASGGVPSIARRFTRLFALLPPSEARRPVPYSPPLIGYVGAVVAAAALIASVSVKPAADWPTLVWGGIAVAAINGYGVGTLSGVDTVWSAAVFVELGLTLTFGPLGALVAAIAHGFSEIATNGFFRAVFNVANTFISLMAGWLAFDQLAGHSRDVWPLAGGGLAAGFCQWVADTLLLTLVIKISNSDARITASIRSSAAVLPYSLGYGWSAAAFVLLHQRGGAVGFSLLLTPGLLLQGFLVFLARRVYAHGLTVAQHAHEREGLLQRIINVSEEERQRIASDLHDGPVQRLAGAALTLSANARRISTAAEPRGSQDRAAVIMEQVAGETRAAMRDLRTLIIQIAPPSLDDAGLNGALGNLLVPLQTRGVSTRLDAPAERPELGPASVSLVFRVAQEALRNVAKYAEPQNVSILIESLGERLKMTVEDDGKGFSDGDTARRRAGGHVGLSLLANAVNHGGGRLEVTSEPGRGTRVTLELAGG